MTGVANDLDRRRRPRSVKSPRALGRANHIVAPLNDDAGDPRELASVFEQLRVGSQKPLVHEVVALDAREREREGVTVHALHEIVVGEQAAGTSLPNTPRPGARLTDVRVVAREASMIRRQEIATLALGDRREVVLPGVGVHRAAASLIEPIDLLLAEKEDAAQHELGHTSGVRLGVREPERAAPRAAEDLPLVDGKMLANALHVGDEIPRGVGLQASVRRASAAATLIEQHDAVRLRIEEATLLRVRSTAGAAVDENDGLALRVPRLFDVDFVHVGDAEAVRPVGFDLGVKGASGGLGHAAF